MSVPEQLGEAVKRFEDALRIAVTPPDATRAMAARLFGVRTEIVPAARVAFNDAIHALLVQCSPVAGRR
jgi:hypothetical protein